MLLSLLDELSSFLRFADPEAAAAPGLVVGGSTAPAILVLEEVHAPSPLHARLRILGYRADRATTRADAGHRLRTGAYALVIHDSAPSLRYDLLVPECPLAGRMPWLVLGESCPRRPQGAGVPVFGLEKPFALRELVLRVEQLLEGRSVMDAVAPTPDPVLTGTLRALVAAIDAKDPHTASHSERVTKLALQLGTCVGLSRQELRTLEFAALLHDLGKIAVPEEILLKPGTLTPEEWSVIQQHPSRSAEIISEVEALSEVARIVRHHHERIDGAGYPDRLSGEGIPYLSRLIAVVDVYEALTCNRAYRGALPDSRARDIIARGLGSHLDRTLGEAFLSLEL